MENQKFFSSFRLAVPKVSQLMIVSPDKLPCLILVEPNPERWVSKPGIAILDLMVGSIESLCLLL